MEPVELLINKVMGGPGKREDCVCVLQGVGRGVALPVWIFPLVDRLSPQGSRPPEFQGRSVARSARKRPREVGDSTQDGNPGTTGSRGSEER